MSDLLEAGLLRAGEKPRFTRTRIKATFNATVTETCGRSWAGRWTAFIERLEEIRHIRNKIMHFHPDPVPSDAVDKLLRFNSLLHRYRDPA